MPLLAAVSPRELTRPIEVIQRLTPPTKGAWPGVPASPASRPFETAKGIGWIGDGEIFLAGRVLRFPPPPHSNGAEPYPLRGQFLLPQPKATVLWDPVSGGERRYPPMNVADLNASGVPVGSRLTKWPSSYISYSSGARYEPRRGGQVLKMATGAVGGLVSAAARRGRLLAGEMIFAENSSDVRRACLWTNERKPPRLLPLPTKWRQSYATAVNSRGDVVGFVQRGWREIHGVIWPHEGGMELLPSGFPERRARNGKAGQAEFWLVESPWLITEDGLILLSEGNLGGDFVKMLSDGKRTIPLKQAIEGEDEIGRFAARLSADGYTLLTGPDEQGSWFRLQWRRPIPEQRP